MKTLKSKAVFDIKLHTALKDGLNLLSLKLDVRKSDLLLTFINKDLYKNIPNKNDVKKYNEILSLNKNLIVTCRFYINSKDLKKYTSFCKNNGYELHEPIQFILNKYV